MSDRGYMEIPNFVNGTGQSLKSELFGFDNEFIYQIMLRPSYSSGQGVGAPNKSLNTNVVTVARISDKCTMVFMNKAAGNDQHLQTVVLTTSGPKINKHTGWKRIFLNKRLVLTLSDVMVADFRSDSASGNASAAEYIGLLFQTVSMI